MRVQSLVIPLMVVVLDVLGDRLSQMTFAERDHAVQTLMFDGAHETLRMLGLDVSERTVSRYRPRARRPPSQTWRTFLANHAPALVSLDFFTVPTATFQVLFVLVVVSHARRRILHWNVTAQLTAAWTAPQIVEACPWDAAPPFLLHARDGLFANAIVSGRVASLGLTDRRHGAARALAESLRGTSDRLDAPGLPRPCDHPARTASAARPRGVRHPLSSGADPSRPAQGRAVPRAIHPPAMGGIVAHAHLGGLHHQYERRAA